MKKIIILLLISTAFLGCKKLLKVNSSCLIESQNGAGEDLFFTYNKHDKVEKIEIMDGGVAKGVFVYYWEDDELISMESVEQASGKRAEVNYLYDSEGRVQQISLYSDMGSGNLEYSGSYEFEYQGDSVKRTLFDKNYFSTLGHEWYFFSGDYLTKVDAYDLNGDRLSTTENEYSQAILNPIYDILPASLTNAPQSKYVPTKVMSTDGSGNTAVLSEVTSVALNESDFPVDITIDQPLFGTTGNVLSYTYIGCD